MPAKCLLLAMCVLTSRAEGADVNLPEGTRIRLMTGTPPWTEKSGVRELPGLALREDEDSLTFQPLGDAEPTTRTKKGRWLEGWLAGGDDRHLMVRLSKNGESLRIPTDAVSRLEVSKGSRRAKGALIGAGAGAAGLALLFALPDPCPRKDRDPAESAFGSLCLFSRGDYAAMGALAGAAWGTAIGFFAGGEKWRAVEGRNFRVRVRVSVAPAPGGGAGAKIAIGF